MGSLKDFERLVTRKTPRTRIESGPLENSLSPEMGKGVVSTKLRVPTLLEEIWIFTKTQ